MTLDRVKVGRADTFMKYLASVVFLIFLPKNLLTFIELVENELLKSISKKSTDILYSIQFIAAYCRDNCCHLSYLVKQEQRQFYYMRTLFCTWLISFGKYHFTNIYIPKFLKI